MSRRKDQIAELYDSLLGSRLVDGQLVIPGYTEPDYEELWEYLMTELVIPLLRGRDYYYWLAAQAARYRKNRRLGEWERAYYDPLTQNRPEELTTRQQLAVIKFYLKRRRYSHY